MALVTRYVNTASSGGDGTTNGEAGATAAYASLSAWEAAEQTDLVGATDQHEVLCSTGSGTASDSSDVTVAGWTTSSTYYVVVKGNADTDDYAGATWDANRYACVGVNLQVNGGVYGVQVRRHNVNSGSGLSLGTTGLELCFAEDCFIYSTGDSYSSGSAAGITLYGRSSTEGGNRIVNCVVHMDWPNGGGSDLVALRGIYARQDGGTAEKLVYNCTAYVRGRAGTVGAGYQLQGATVRSINNISIVEDLGGAASIPCFSRTFFPDDFYEASSDDTAAGTGSRINQTFTFMGTLDYRLSMSDGGAKDFGTSLSSDTYWPFSDDIDGVSRPQGSEWDIGASEAVPTVPDGSMHSVYLLGA